MSQESRSIAEEVKIHLDADPYLRNCLERGLLNIRAVARYLSKKMRKPDAEYAIINAIRRYPVDLDARDELTIDDLLKNAKISLKNKVVDVQLVADPHIQKMFGKIIPHIKFEKGEIFRVFAGVESFKAILDEQNLEELSKVIPKSSIVKVQDQLAEITITGPPEMEKVPGGVAKISTLLAIHKINIFEMMYSYSDFVILVDEKDAVTAYQLLSRIC